MPLPAATLPGAGWAADEGDENFAGPLWRGDFKVLTDGVSLRIVIPGQAQRLDLRILSTLGDCADQVIQAESACIGRGER